MMNFPKISVVIPVYNRETTIYPCIISVLEQDYPDIETIVVDDGSTDSTPEILESFRKKIHIIRQPNLGVSAARNRGIKEANADIIAFLDSDDLWMPGKLLDQVKVLEDPKIILSFTNFKIGPEGKNAFEHLDIKFENDMYKIKNPVNYVFRRGGHGIQIQTCLCRKSIIMDIGGFEESLRIGEDTKFIFLMSMKGQFHVSNRIYMWKDKFSVSNKLTNTKSITYQGEQAKTALYILDSVYDQVNSISAYAGKDITELKKHFYKKMSKIYAQKNDLFNSRIYYKKSMEDSIYSKLKKIITYIITFTYLVRYRYLKKHI